MVLHGMTIESTDTAIECHEVGNQSQVTTADIDTVGLENGHHFL